MQYRASATLYQASCRPWGYVGCPSHRLYVVDVNTRYSYTIPLKRRQYLSTKSSPTNPVPLLWPQDSVIAHPPRALIDPPATNLILCSPSIRRSREPLSGLHHVAPLLENIAPTPTPRASVNFPTLHTSKSPTCVQKFLHTSVSRKLLFTNDLIKPPTKANRVQSQAGSPDFRKWESCRTIPLVGGFSRGSPVSPSPSFMRRSMFTSIAFIGSQDLAMKLSQQRRFPDSGYPLQSLLRPLQHKRRYSHRSFSRRYETTNQPAAPPTDNLPHHAIANQTQVPFEATVAELLACSPPTKTGFSHVGVVPGDAVDWRVFSGISRFPHPSIPTLLHIHLNHPTSALKTSMLRAVQISSLTSLVPRASRSQSENGYVYIYRLFTLNLATPLSKVFDPYVIRWTIISAVDQFAFVLCNLLCTQVHTAAGTGVWFQLTSRRRSAKRRRHVPDCKIGLHSGDAIVIVKFEAYIRVLGTLFCERRVNVWVCVSWQRCAMQAEELSPGRTSEFEHTRVSLWPIMQVRQHIFFSSMKMGSLARRCGVPELEAVRAVILIRWRSSFHHLGCQYP
ncbi:hypothetical protein PR048_009383 [Dryococelus australis]|uniref:Uncharacterized protein n=1 Tax=Dryococelus australis TaxID=614101 RepID=A0ABQ9HZT4_9NEOP|nr:hypothetical protein PR048_009383 [Dryococelus australis]